MKEKIKCFNPSKSYRFIETVEWKNIFLHQSVIQIDTEYLNEGHQVEFEMIRTDSCDQAKN